MTRAHCPAALGGMYSCPSHPPSYSRSSIPRWPYGAVAGLALAMAAKRLVASATLGVLLMHQIRYDACDRVACLAEGSLSGS